MLSISGLETKYNNKPLPPRPVRSTEVHHDENEQLRRQNAILVAENRFLIEENVALRDKLSYHTSIYEHATKGIKDLRKGMVIMHRALSDINAGDRVATKELSLLRQERQVETESAGVENERITVFAEKDMI